MQCGWVRGWRGWERGKRLGEGKKAILIVLFIIMLLVTIVVTNSLSPSKKPPVVFVFPFGCMGFEFGI